MIFHEEGFYTLFDHLRNEFVINSGCTHLFVSQRLYDFGKTSSSVENSRQQLAAGQKDLEGSIADVVLNVKVAYFEMLKRIRLEDVAKESFIAYDKHLKQAKALFETGNRPRIDVTKSTVDRYRSRLALLKAGFAIRTAKVDLENAIGRLPVKGVYSIANIAKTALTEAEENMVLAKGRYGTGLADAIEFSDAEMNLTIAKNDMVDATYEYLQNLARLEYSVGAWKNHFSEAVSN